MKHYLQTIFTLLVVMMWCGGGYAQDATTAKQTSFTATTATNLGGDENVSYTAYKGGGTGNVRVNESQIYLYQIGSGNTFGGYITVKVAEGYKITSATIGSSMATQVAYSLDDATTPSSTTSSLAANNTYSVSDLEADAITFYCMGTSKNARLYVNYLSVTYKVDTSTPKTETTLTFPQSSYTFASTDDLTGFTGQTATLKASEEELKDQTITYSQSGDNIFGSFDETTGALTLNGTVGTATVTATFDATDAYLKSTASYTVTVKEVIADIATLKSKVTATSSSKPQTFTLKLTDAIVTYKNGNNVYLEDATGGLYSSATGGSTLEVNDKINGLVTINIYNNQGQRRVNNWELDAAATIEKDATFTPTKVTLAELNADIDRYENMRVRVEGATVADSMANQSTKITQDDATITLFDKAKLDTWTLKADDYVDVEGYPCYYNKTNEICVWKLGDVTINTSVVATTLAFDPATTEYTVLRGKESAFQAPKAVVTDANNETVTDAVVTYSSSNANVASVAEDGTVTFGNIGTATITASYAGDATHKAAKDVSYKIIYGKVKTTLAWSATEAEAHVGETFTAPTLTLTADDETLTDKTFTYESSNTDVATIDEEGTVTINEVEGTTTITASYAGDDIYAESTASYTLTITDPNKFVATFDFMNPGKYGYGTTSGSPTYGEGAGDVAEGDTLKEGDVMLINTKMTSPGTRFYNDGMRMYKDNTHTLSVPAGYRITSVAFGDGASSYTIGDAEANTSWTGTAKKVVITYTGGNKKVKSLTVGYKKLDLPSFTLTEGDNDMLILENENTDANVTVTRNLVADSAWYTLCVPFDVEDVKTTPLKDAEVRKYQSMNGTTMNFEATTSLKAFHAYLVRPTKDIYDPVFEDVTLVAESDNVVDGSDGYSFVGAVSETKLKTDGTNLFLGADNKFFVPSTDDCTIKALRGYFVVPEGTNETKLAINIDGETTLISALNNHALKQDGKVYNLNGQYIGTDINTLQKGIYLVNGKKLIVK